MPQWQVNIYNLKWLNLFIPLGRYGPGGRSARCDSGSTIDSFRQVQNLQKPTYIGGSCETVPLKRLMQSVEQLNEFASEQSWAQRR
jgi:hypothetical protein